MTSEAQCWLQTTGGLTEVEARQLDTVMEALLEEATAAGDTRTHARSQAILLRQTDHRVSASALRLWAISLRCYHDRLAAERKRYHEFQHRVEEAFRTCEIHMPECNRCQPGDVELIHELDDALCQSPSCPLAEGK